MMSAEREDNAEMKANAGKALYFALMFIALSRSVAPASPRAG
jgi:hypothetical protein